MVNILLVWYGSYCNSCIAKFLLSIIQNIQGMWLYYSLVVLLMIFSHKLYTVLATSGHIENINT